LRTLKARPISLAAAGLLAALGLAAGTAASAQAATAAGASGSASASVVQQRSITPNVTAIEYGAVSAHGTAVAKAAATTSITPALSACDVVYWRDTSSDLCATGTYYDGGAPYRWPVTTLDLYAPNRVWLHQNEDGSGWSLCLTGGYQWTVTGDYQDPGNILVSGNTAAC